MGRDTIHNDGSTILGLVVVAKHSATSGTMLNTSLSYFASIARLFHSLLVTALPPNPCPTWLILCWLWVCSMRKELSRFVQSKKRLKIATAQ